MEGTVQFLSAAAQLPTINVDKGGFLGNTTAAGLGAIFIWMARRSIRRNQGLWGTWVAGKVKVTWDWKSWMTFFVGFFCVTMILGSGDNIFRNFLRWVQSIFVRLGETVSFIQVLGAGGIAIILFYLAISNKDDSAKDLNYGIVCAIFFPLAGGWAMSVSTAVAGLVAGTINQAV